jgi:uncharacterized Zn finger protein
MGRWRDDNYGGWGYYPKGQPRRAVGGIKTRKERGAIGETWWSRRWVDVLEDLGMGARLARGRSYARQGQVLSIDIAPGLVTARVQGSRSRPYDIIIKLKPLTDRDWERVTEALAEQAIFAAKLLAGEMPTNIEEVFNAVHVSLFPTTQRDLVTDCSCPDWANPCKHIAAVYYILAERFDEDPFLIFKLRGRTKEEIIESLREKRAASLPAEQAAALADGQSEAVANEAPLRLEDYRDTFWQAGEELETFAVRPGHPDIDKAILKRLGNGPYEIGGRNLASLLAKAYDAAEDGALRRMPTVE